MIGRSRRNAEARRRRAEWLKSLTPEEHDLEMEYQAMVDRRYFPLLAPSILVYLLMLWPLSKLPRPDFVGMWGLLFPLSLAIPFLFIPTSAAWKAEARRQRAESRRQDI